jgi:hypothetical protein
VFLLVVVEQLDAGAGARSARAVGDLGLLLGLLGLLLSKVTAGLHVALDLILVVLRGAVGVAEQAANDMRTSD